MRPQAGYLPFESNAPLRGLATSPVSTRLDPAFSPRLLNCTVRDGIVRRRPGYRQLGRQLVGRVMGIVEFTPVNEDTYFIVLTSRRQYIYDPATEDFLDLTPGQVTYAITQNSDTFFIVAGDQTATFTAGLEFGVVDSGGNDGWYTVVSSTLVLGDTRITVQEAIPELNGGGDIVLADDFTTQDGDSMNWVGVTDINGSRFIVTNGRDIPRVWDGDPMNPFADWTPTFTGFVTCKTLAVFDEHLFLGGVTTATTEPALIAWSDSGDFDQFNTGNSGSQLLYQLQSIEALKVLGDRLAIYSHDTIMSAVFVDLPAVFSFEVVIPEGTRLTTDKSIVSVNVGHIYASEENFYLFDGTRGLRVLGDAIYNEYKTNKDHEMLYKVAALNDYAKRTIYFAIPDISGGASIYTAEYDVFDLSRITWAKERYAHAPTAFGFFVNRTLTLSWDDAPWEAPLTPWSEELGTWAEEAEQVSFPIRCFGTAEGRVYIVTEGTLSDNGTTVEQTYETMDFSAGELFQSLVSRWTEIEFDGFGSEVTVSISDDLGRSFTEIETVDLAQDPRPYKVYIDRSSRNLRVKFSSDSDFGLRWIRLWTRPGAPR